MNDAETGSAPNPRGSGPGRPRARDFLVILIVDDDPGLSGFLALLVPDVFGERNVVIQALSVNAAAPMFEEATETDIVLVDGPVEGDPDGGLRVMTSLRAAGYRGPFVAIATDTVTRERMMRAGCAGASSKNHALDLAALILDMTAAG